MVKKYSSNKHSRGIRTWDQLVSMLHGHLAGAPSLRDTGNGLRSTLGNRSHLGLIHVPVKPFQATFNKALKYNIIKNINYRASYRASYRVSSVINATTLHT